MNIAHIMTGYEGESLKAISVCVCVSNVSVHDIKPSLIPLMVEHSYGMSMTVYHAVTEPNILQNLRHKIRKYTYYEKVNYQITSINVDLQVKVDGSAAQTR